MGFPTWWLYPGRQVMSREEKQQRRWIIAADVVMLPVLTMCYFGVAAWLRTSGGVPHDTTPPHQMAAWVCCIVQVLVLYQHMIVAPMPTRDMRWEYNVQSWLGRWVYLTRIILTVQAIHAVVSLMWPEESNGLALIVSGFGVFVTVQYLTLVHWSQMFLESCKQAATKNIPLRPLMLWLHLPNGAVAVVDVLKTKQRDVLLSAIPSVACIVQIIISFALLYIGIVHLNFYLTQEWPYHVLYPLGLNPLKWATFIAMQVLILCTFVAVTFATAVYGPVF